ncbi:cytosolic phospholipase A2 gamma [Misgurnus anguillicaudatus]|uniref:cytosolic phospholipase A2 gamma n=1 Tax=Misgurnus anguillicaudatus TaxID=75329 RepID=UPI003CCF10DF
MRIGNSLNKDEEQFVTKRIKTVQQSLMKLGIQCPENNVPKIALLGSGGGERAMLGLLGSLVELDKIGLLDCILYLSGISGSTWCMASLYKESNWSSNLDSVKQKTIQRLKGPAVSWGDKISKLKKYYYEKDNFNLTDLWAVMMVPLFVKEIDEHKVSQQQAGHDKDPFPIYTVIDKGFKQHCDGDPWFEISPYEAGYSITRAFVNISKFGSQFQGGSEIKIQPEMDMLYLQAVCGSCIADGVYNAQYIWEMIKEFIHEIFQRKGEMFETMPNVQQLFMDLVEMNLSGLKGEHPSDYENKIRATLSEFDGGECKLDFHMEITDFKLYTENFTVAVCDHLKLRLSFWPFNVISSLCKCAALWIWGRTYNYLYKRKDLKVPTVLQKSETRDYEDAGILLNSPYMSVLRQERDIDLIISLDFSDGDPFETVKKAADMCSKLKIPFPKVDTPSVKDPKDFYVFEGLGKVPTVIHIPLFNTVNCGNEFNSYGIEEWRKKYTTFQSSYNPEMIDPLVDVAGKNITNNREKVLREIIKRIGAKSAKR